LQSASKSPILTAVRPNELPPSPTLKLTLDRAQAQSMGLTTTDVYQTIQLMLAPVYVNDFYYEGRVLRATMQADAPFRMNENSLRHFYLPAGTNSTTNSFAVTGDDAGDNMVPLSSVLRSEWNVTAPSLARYNGYAAININGAA